MRRILSERNLVVVLFISALVIFILAQEDTKEMEKNFKYPETAVLPASPAQSASNNVMPKPELPGTQSVE